MIKTPLQNKIIYIANIKKANDELCTTRLPEVADMARRKIIATSNALWKLKL